MGRIEETAAPGMYVEHIGTTTATFHLVEGDKIVRDVTVRNVLGNDIVSDMIRVKDDAASLISAGEYASSKVIH